MFLLVPTRSVMWGISTMGLLIVVVLVDVVVVVKLNYL